MPRKHSEDDFSHIPNVAYVSPLELKPNRVLIGLGVGLVVIILGTLGYFLIDALFLGKSATAVPNIEIKNNIPTIKIATPSAQKDEAAGWHLYSNEKFKFSINYPPNFSLEEPTESNDSFMGGSFRSPNLSHGDLSNPIKTGGEIVIWIEPSSKSLDQELDKLAQPDIGCCPFIVKSKIKIQLDQTNAYKGVHDWGTVEVEYVLSIKKGMSYHITARASESEKLEINKIFSLMISTFKFLD